MVRGLKIETPFLKRGGVFVCSGGTIRKDWDSEEEIKNYTKATAN